MKTKLALLTLLLAAAWGCSTPKAPVKSQAVVMPMDATNCLDPSNTNCQCNCTNTYQPNTNFFVINTNFPWLSITNLGATITATLNHSTPGDTYYLFAATNRIPSGPLPTATNEFNWLFLEGFTGSASPINFGGFPTVTPLYNGLFLLTLDVTAMGLNFKTQLKKHSELLSLKPL